MRRPETRPLDGRTVVITRPRVQSAVLVDALQREGARVVTFPTIRIEPVKDTGPIDRAINRLGDNDWVIFTSANGVERFFSCLYQRGHDAGVFQTVRVAAIGPATAEALRVRDVHPDQVPERYQAEGLVEALAGVDWRGRRVLIPRAEKAREVLPGELRRLGAAVEVLAVYRTVRPPTDPAPLRAALVAREISAITFTSSSTVSHFAHFFDEGEAARLLREGGVAVACIGPITSATARQTGFDVSVEAEVFTVEGLVAALSRHFAKDGSGRR